VLRFSFFVLLFVSLAAFGQSTARKPGAHLPAAAPQSIPPQVAEAEAAIVKSDWKAAEARLNPWLAAHPSDARALFDAGYVADAQNRLDDAVALYRRAVEANPQSFEAHVELGLLLARLNKLSDARIELAAASELDPGEAGAVAKARSVMGATNSPDAALGTLRREFGTNNRYNVTHGSDSPASAEREIQFFFKPDELFAFGKDDWKL